MATFKACVQKQRKDGFWPVYIRVTHNRNVQYIKTDKVVAGKGLAKDGTIRDPFVMEYCMRKIIGYGERLNRVDIRKWSGREVVDWLLHGEEDICFSDYARKYVSRLAETGHVRNAKSYDLALRHLERFMGTERIMFSHLSARLLERWIKSMEGTHRAKEHYPVCLRQVYKAALMEFNDYENGDLRIWTNPWLKVRIPKADKAEQLAITPEECRAFFSFPLPESNYKVSVPELGRDVAMMVLCLAGINAADIYALRKADCTGGIIRYRRAKTRNSRADGAYIEMRIPPILSDVVAKHSAPDDDPFLFGFHRRMTTLDSFVANVNVGIRRICEAMGMERGYSTYTFRHTWATVAQNDVHASLSEVAFAMNHSAGFGVTRGYVKADFTPAWELNEKVVDFIFFSDAKSAQRRHEETEEMEPIRARFSTKDLVRAEAFFQGRRIAHVEDIGFSSLDAVFRSLVTQFPDDIPRWSVVIFRVELPDKGEVTVYQRQKGKGHLF